MNCTSDLDVGDIVVWSSQAGGRTKEKIGKVVADVPPGVDPFRNLRKYLMEKYNCRCALGGGMARPDRSLLVLVNPGPRRKPILYWPRVNQLRRKSLEE